MSRHRAARLESRVTNLSAILLGVGFAVVGGIGLYVSGTSVLSKHQQAAAFVSQLGGLLVATGLITVAWDLFGRRALADEVLAKAQVGADVGKAGIARVTNQYLEDVQWADLFQDVHRLDIVVAYANTWRNTHRSRLEDAARRPGTRIRIFLPDPTNQQTMEVLSTRFDVEPDVLRTRIDEAITDFRSLATSGGADLEVLVRSGDVVFSCYRFDSRAVLTLYSHSRKRRTQVPTFVVSGGDLFQFVYDELQALVEQSTPAP